MSQNVAPLPAFPALFQTVPAGRAQRLARGLLSWVVTLAFGLGLTFALVAARGVGTPAQPVWIGIWVVLTGAVAVVVALVAGAAGGGIPELLLGLRVVRISDGRRPAARGIGRAALGGLAAALSLGIVPLVASLRPDREGLTWLDRVTGTALIDVRAGRNVIANPVTDEELTSHFAPKPVPLPAIVDVRPAPPVSPAGPVAPPPVDERARASTSTAGRFDSVDGATRIASTLRPEPGTAAPSTTWMLSFDTGERHPLHDRALIGRKPEALAGYRGADLIQIDDPSRTVSATHLAVTTNELGIWVEDLGSTNGSEVRSPNGRTQALPVRVRTPVAGGSRVRLGDRWMAVERTGT